MTRTLASGAESATALARSRTIDALVLNRSGYGELMSFAAPLQGSPSRVIPGFRGTPAGMRTISAPVRHFFKPSASGW